jgi:hypothetical protein
MVADIGEEMASQCWDHLARDPANPSAINSTTMLKGKAFGPTPDGFSRVVHYRTSSSWRVDYRYHQAFSGGERGDPHQVTVVLDVFRSSAGT